MRCVWPCWVCSIPRSRRTTWAAPKCINVFRIPKVGTIAGCRVQDGVIRRDSEVKVMRGGEQVYKGKIGSLKRFKDDAREVTNGMECGIGLADFSDLKEGDLIEAFSTEKMAADLGALTSAKA